MEKKRMEFYGGILGAILPFLVMVAIMITLTITKNNGLKCFWVAGLAALCISFLMAKDKKEVHTIAIDSLRDPMFSTMVIIFLLAGVLSYMLRDSGLINGLIWMCTSLNINAGLLPAATFLISVVISTACGTQGGTISTVTPIMFPLAVQMGCHPAVMLGAIIGGAMFGDNLAPISDTTIASSGAFHANVKQVVQSRIKYSLIAGTVALVLFVIFGLSTASAHAAAYTADSSSAMTLIMLIVPIIMIIMMLKGAELVPVLLVCNIMAFAFNVIFGFVPLATMITTDSPIVRGMDGMTGVIFFTVWIMIQNGYLKAAGVFEILIEKLGNICKSARSAELISMIVITVTIMMTASGTVTIVVSGPVVYELFKKFNIDRHRGANYLDGTACGAGAILPWNNSVLIMLGLAVATELIPADYSPLNFLPFSFYSFALLGVYLICALTGLFRKDDEKNYQWDTKKIKA